MTPTNPNDLLELPDNYDLLGKQNHMKEIEQKLEYKILKNVIIPTDCRNRNGSSSPFNQDSNLMPFAQSPIGKFKVAPNENHTKYDITEEGNEKFIASNIEIGVEDDYDIGHQNDQDIESNHASDENNEDIELKFQNTKSRNNEIEAETDMFHVSPITTSTVLSTNDEFTENHPVSPDNYQSDAELSESIFEEEDKDTQTTGTNITLINSNLAKVYDDNNDQKDDIDENYDNEIINSDFEEYNDISIDLNKNSPINRLSPILNIEYDLKDNRDSPSDPPDAIESNDVIHQEQQDQEEENMLIHEESNGDYGLNAPNDNDENDFPVAAEEEYNNDSVREEFNGNENENENHKDIEEQSFHSKLKKMKQGKKRLISQNLENGDIIPSIRARRIVIYDDVKLVRP